MDELIFYQADDDNDSDDDGGNADTCLIWIACWALW